MTADALSLGELATIAEFSSECVCIGTSQWLDAKAQYVDVSELAGKPFVGPSGTFQTRLNAWLNANGVQVDAMICAPGETPDAQLTEISAPSSCYLGQQFTVRGTIQSNVEASGTLILYANGKPVQKREIEHRSREIRV